MESIRKRVKVNAFRYSLSKMNKKIKKYFGQHAYYFCLKRLDQRFIKNASIALNKKWNKESLLNLYRFNFYDEKIGGKKYEGTYVNKEIIRQFGMIDSHACKKIIRFLQNTTVEYLIRKYLASSKFKNDVEKCIVKDGEKYAEEFVKIAKSYLIYYENEKPNQKKK
jgi:hypothetical protein